MPSLLVTAVANQWTLQLQSHQKKCQSLSQLQQRYVPRNRITLVNGCWEEISWWIDQIHVPRMYVSREYCMEFQGTKLNNVKGMERGSKRRNNWLNLRFSLFRLFVLCREPWQSDERMLWNGPLTSQNVTLLLCVAIYFESRSSARTWFTGSCGNVMVWSLWVQRSSAVPTYPGTTRSVEFRCLFLLHLEDWMWYLCSTSQKSVTHMRKPTYFVAGICQPQIPYLGVSLRQNLIFHKDT